MNIIYNLSSPVPLASYTVLCKCDYYYLLLLLQLLLLFWQSSNQLNEPWKMDLHLVDTDSFGIHVH